MKRSFYGGVHPPYHKELTNINEEINAFEPSQVILPMRQHIGKECMPLVEVGEYVRVGQKVGDGDGLCVPVHASVSGVVKSIAPAPFLTGTEVNSITIENDFQNTLSGDIEPCENIEDLNSDELLRKIREAGIAGMGGAAFPTAAKAASCSGKIDVLIINGCECEPYITADDALMRKDAESVLDGAELLRKALRAGKAVLAVEENKPEAVSALKTAQSAYTNIEIRVLPTKYPQGSERQLIYAVTGREVPFGKLPADIGCGVFNVGTSAAVSRAVRKGMPLVQRVVTVTGDCIKNPQNFLAPLGTQFSRLIEAAGGLTQEICSVISGGPMTGFAQKTTEVPVVKGTNCILCLSFKEKVKDPRCIRCGKCIQVCPVYLQPLYLYRYEAVKDTKQLKRLHLTDCIECGCCSYICPGKLPLTENFRRGKQLLKERKS